MAFYDEAAIYEVTIYDEVVVYEVAVYDEVAGYDQDGCQWTEAVGRPEDWRV